MISRNIGNTGQQRRQGQVVVLIALLSVFLIGMAGLAVDLVLAYAVKTFLATATDAAAMGGVRALERGVSYSEQQSEVERVVNMLFNANFPDGLLMTGNTGRLEQNVKIAGSTLDPGAPSLFTLDPGMQPGMREIRVTTIAEAPTFFMRYFGMDSVTVRASAYAARRDVNVMVVLDRSASLKNVGAWDDVQNAAKAFIEKFDNNRDRVGLVTFGTGANVDRPLATGFKNNSIMLNLIFNQIVPNSAYTNSSQGMWLAYSELMRVNDPNALNAIVFFTDGQPSAVSATFRTRSLLAGGLAPRCMTSTEEGTLGAGQDTAVWNNPRFYDIRGFWRREAGPVPVNLGNLFYDHPLNLRCLNILDVYGANVEDMFDSSKPWPSSWTGAETGSPAKTFCIKPGASGCLGTSGNFPYSTTDSRLFSDSSNYSNSTFRGTNVHNAAKNLLLNIAQAARQDASLGGVNIHTIGLGGYGYDADAELMKSVANDPSNSYGVQITAAADEPKGSYTYAPGIDEIQAAFEKVRSEVMRLTR